MAIIKSRCSRAYRTMSVNGLGQFGEQVSAGIYTNAGTFDTPPITEVAFNALVQDFQTKRGQYTQGGINYKEPYEAALTALIGGLDQNASYVDGVANGNPTIIQMAGYVPTKDTRTQASRPEQITGLELIGNKGGSIEVNCTQQVGVEAYVCIMTEGAPLPEMVKVTDSGKIIFDAAAMGEIRAMMIDSQAPRRKVFSGLNAGTRYYFAYVGINAKGVGPLSAPLAVVCGL